MATATTKTMATMGVFQATASAPVNIACIKYWGKRDTKLILPVNSSLSLTIDQQQLCSTTTSRADPSFERDRLWLNGVESVIESGGRLSTCILVLKHLRADLVEAESPDLPKLSSWHVHISSFNTVPTAAGLASSASGFAALISSLAALYELPCTPSELSLISRRGSGSACRSLFGGFVAWEMGSRTDGTDSLAVQIAPESHWEDMHVLVCVITGAKKATPSTAGMQRTVETSTLLPYRAIQIVPQRLRDITKAIHAKDFDTFARITMADSNQFHAVALDTDPPIIYLNDASRAIIAIITEYNRVALAEAGVRKAAYTFDAGPNAVIFTPASNVKEIIELFAYYFPQKAAFRDPFGLFPKSHQPTPKLVPGFNKDVSSVFELGAMQTLIHTKIGDGPRILGEKESLLDASGLPKIEDAMHALDLSRADLKEQLAAGSEANASSAIVAGHPDQPK